MSEMNTKFVEFDEYCPKCKYSELSGYSDPCNECLECGANEGSVKPVKYVPSKGEVSA